MVEVYSLGDAQLLWKVFNAAARLRGTGTYAYLGMIGSMIGMLLVFWKFLSSAGKEFPLHYFLLSLLMFTVMFKPTVNVAVHQMVPTPYAQVNEVYTTDDVPVGVAIPMAVITGFGYALSVLMDTNFGSPDFGTLQNGGFGGAIEKLTFIRKIDGMTIAGNETLSPVARSLLHHLDDCVRKADNSVGDSTSFASTDRFRRAAFADVIHVQSEWYTTKSFLGADGAPVLAGEPEVISCTESSERLASASQHESVTQAMDVVAEHLMPSIEGETPTDSINRMFSTVATTTQVTMRDYTFNALTRMLWDSAQARALMSGHDASAAIMLENASQQRASQWASEETMFARILRPITMFFEALVPALAPIMALMVMLGPFGITLVGRYFVLALWVALWLPLLTITSAFGTHTMERFLIALDASGDPLGSITGINQILIAAQDWVATAGLIGSATPMLALSLLFGGAYTATALAGRLQGGDHTNEKIMSPDAVQPAPAVQMSAGFTHSPMEGMRRLGAESQLPNYSTRDAASSAESNARSLMEQANTNVTRTFGDAVQRNGGWSEQAQEIVQSGTEKAFGQNWGEAVNKLQQAGFDVGSAQKLGLSNSQITEVAGQAAAGMPVDLISARISGMLKDSSTVSRESVRSFAESLSQSVGRSSAFNASFSDGMKWSLGTSSGQSFTDGLSASSSKQVQDAVSASETASQTYQEARSRSLETGIGTNMKATEAAQGILDAGMGNEVYAWAERANFASQPGVNALDENVASLQRFGLDEQSARVAGALMTLSGHGHAASDRAASGAGFSAAEISGRSELFNRALATANPSFMGTGDIGDGYATGRDTFAPGARALNIDALRNDGNATRNSAPTQNNAAVFGHARSGLGRLDEDANANGGLSIETLQARGAPAANAQYQGWSMVNTGDRKEAEEASFQQSAKEYDRSTNWMGTTWGVLSGTVSQPFYAMGDGIAAIAADVHNDLNGKGDLDFAGQEFMDMRQERLAEHMRLGGELFAGNQDAARYYGMLKLQGGSDATSVADTIADIPGSGASDLVYQDSYRAELHDLAGGLRESNPGLEIAVRQAASLQNPWTSSLATQYRAISETPGE
jgi:conjugal transfer mating pair stabilization protein TraG